MRKMDNETIITNINKSATVVENLAKIWKTLVAILTVFVLGGYWAASFYFQYQENITNGSPALRTLIKGQEDEISATRDLIRENKNAADHAAYKQDGFNNLIIQRMEQTDRRMDLLQTQIDHWRK